MSEAEASFQRDFQQAAIEICRLYSTAYTSMEIELGSGLARRLAPVILQTVVNSAQQAGLQRQQERQDQALLRQFAAEEQAEEERRRQMTIEDVLGGAGTPW